MVLFGVTPEFEASQAILQRLAGLVKHVIAAESGVVSVERLAAALAQRPAVARYGLDWLAAKGYITVQELPAEPGKAIDGVHVQIFPGGRVDDEMATLALEHIRFLLDETRAYRAYFLKNDMLAKIDQ